MTYPAAPSRRLRRTTRRALAAGVAFAAALMASAPSHAQPHVRWIAPDECPQGREFAAALRGRLSERGALERVSAVDAQIRRSGKRGYTLALSLSTGGRDARRVLSADACRELLDATVWLVVLALGPSAASDGVRPDALLDAEDNDLAPGSALTARAPGDTVEPPTEHGTAKEGGTETKSAPRALGQSSRKDEASSLSTQPIPPPREIHARIAGFGGLFAGAGAKVQGALGFTGDVSVGVLHTQVMLADLLPAREHVAGGGHVQVWSLALGLSECALWGTRVSAGPCAGVEGIRTVAHSRDFGREVNRTVLWAAVDVGLQLLWPLTASLELKLAGNVAVPVTPRPRFTVAGAGVVAAAERVSEQVHLGLIYRAL